MAVSLDLVLLSKVGLKPSFRVEFFGVGPPEPFGLVHQPDWDEHRGTFRDENTGDGFASAGNNRGTQR